MERIILISGGIDSYLASIFALTDNTKLVFINYGQKYAKYELNACENLYDDFDIINIGESCVELDNNYIPSRNLYLALSVVNRYYPDEILISGLKDDNCADKNKNSFKEFSEIITKYSKKEIKVFSPFLNNTKGELISRYLSLGYSVKKLLSTFSCYEGYKCGNCAACFRWYVALESNNIYTGMNLSTEIISKYLNSIENYDIDRKKRIISLFYERI